VRFGFHADPPEATIARQGGRIAFIDCGMTGQLDTKTPTSLPTWSPALSPGTRAWSRSSAAWAPPPES
jgi:hypothetical protein